VKVSLTVLSLVLLAGSVSAQSVCPTTATSRDLICVIPQLYGPGGLTLPNPFHSAHFNSDFEASFTPLNSALGIQLTLLPIASPASGFTYTFDRSLGVFTRSAESFGPLLTERAETIGRHKLYAAFTYQHFGFSSLDGIDLQSVPAVFTHIDCCNPNGSTRTATDPPSPGAPQFEQDFITTNNQIDFKVNQFTFFGTVGITDRIDASIAVPIMDVTLRVTSNAQIVRNSSPSPIFGFAHYFDAGCGSNISCQAASTQKTFFNAAQATGIGDIVLRVKGTVWRGERNRAAAGVDVRVPTGNELNFLGAGATGVRPFIAFSHRARISPHVNIGYQWNGDSILAGEVTLGVKSKLPDQFFYSGGVDYGISSRITVAVDLIGQRVFAADRAVVAPYTDILGRVHQDVQQTAIVKGSFNADDLGVGAKFSPWRNLLLSANVLIKLDDAGLRSRIVPLVGVSYTF
jgi:hypothetical protein